MDSPIDICLSNTLNIFRLQNVICVILLFSYLKNILTLVLKCAKVVLGLDDRYPVRNLLLGVMSFMLLFFCRLDLSAGKTKVNLIAV